MRVRLLLQRAFESTPLYRNIKLRGAVVQDRQLVVLPHEEVYQMVDGAWNLANDAVCVCVWVEVYVFVCMGGGVCVCVCVCGGVCVCGPRLRREVGIGTIIIPTLLGFFQLPLLP